jgi:hypothetical protein
VVDVTANDATPTLDSIVPPAWSSGPAEHPLGLREAAREIRAGLERYMEAVAAAYPSASVFVCLSGRARQLGHRGVGPRAIRRGGRVSFDLTRPGSPASQDRAIGQRLARDFDMPLLEVDVDDELQCMDTVLVEGIDWRDFNVHTRLVNAALAAAIDGTLPARDPATPVLVLTGDLANEFLVDYHPENYKEDGP